MKTMTAPAVITCVDLAHPGLPPTTVRQIHPSIRMLGDGNDVVVVITSRDREVVLENHSAWIAVEAMHACPEPGRRHAAGANLARRKAGEIAMRLQDVEARAALMDVLDLWSGVLGDKNFAKPAWLDGAGVVRLVCPSTGRIYAHVVPPECTNEREARAWVMTALAPEWARKLPIGKTST